MVGCHLATSNSIMSNAIECASMRFHLLRLRDYIFHSISEVAIYHQRITSINLRWNWYIFAFVRFNNNKKPSKIFRKNFLGHIHLLCLWFGASLSIYIPFRHFHNVHFLKIQCSELLLFRWIKRCGFSFYSSTSIC